MAQPMMQECSEAMLGALAPSCELHLAGHDPISGPHHNTRDGSAVVNGVVLSRLVVDELRRLGVPLSWYPAGHLEAAADGCAYDGRLIDDPHGEHFYDQLTLTDQEIALRRIGHFRDHYWKDRVRRHDDDEVCLDCS